ncbi:MAG: flagellin [Pseudomonadota bacterium]
MALTVNTNTASLNAINNLNQTQRSLAGSYSRISSGLRITRAADDAAGLGVAESLGAQAASGRVAMRNTNDGISVIQTAEGAMDSVGDILARMRELAVQSSSETLADDDRAYIQAEFEQLSGEIDRVANSTEFNGTALCDGTTTQLDVQVGIMNTANDRITITLSDLSASSLGVDTASMDLSTTGDAQTAIDDLDTAIGSVNGFRADLGAVQNRLDSALSNMETYTENLSGAESQIRDADFAFETAELAKNQILQQAGVSVLAQAKTMNQGALSLLG